MQIHLQLLHDERLGAHELAVYMGLVAHADFDTGESYPSLTRLCKYTNLSEPTVRKSLKRLVATGYASLKVEDGRPNKYFLKPPPELPTPDPGLGVERVDPQTSLRGTPKRQSGGSQTTVGGTPKGGLGKQEPIEQEPITRGVVEREIPRSEPSGGLPMMVKSTDGGSTVKPMFWPALAAKTATEVLDNASTPGQPKLTPRERKALRPQVIEWLQAGWASEALSAAIAASPFKTPNAVGGELRKQQSPVSGQAKKSVGDSNLEAAGRFLERHSKESK